MMNAHQTSPENRGNPSAHTNPLIQAVWQTVSEELKLKLRPVHVKDDGGVKLDKETKQKIHPLKKKLKKQSAFSSLGSEKRIQPNRQKLTFCHMQFLSPGDASQ